MPLGNLHQKALRNYRLYMLVGGMPQSVLAYLETKSLENVDKVKRNVLKIYQDDIYKYSDGLNSKVSAIFERIIGQLSKDNKKFY